MKHYLLDTNILIDYLLYRHPFGADATELMQAGASGEAHFYVVSVSFPNIDYIIRRQPTAIPVRQLLAELAQLVEIVAVDAVVIRQALASEFTDFEDAIQYFAALGCPEINAIVTHDATGFRQSTLPVLTAAQALNELDQAAQSSA
jgi:predicted nucleic acid-binding protein